jgi:hypothetical protein
MSHSQSRRTSTKENQKRPGWVRKKVSMKKMALGKSGKRRCPKVPGLSQTTSPFFPEISKAYSFNVPPSL